MARRCPVRISTLTDIPGDNGMSLPSMLIERRERPIVAGNTKPWTLAGAVAVVEACGFTAEPGSLRAPASRSSTASREILRTSSP